MTYTHIDFDNILRRSLDIATSMHGDQMYGDKPYRYHLERVEKVLERFFNYNIGFDKVDELILKVSAHFHDVLEDTNVTAEQLQKVLMDDLDLSPLISLIVVRNVVAVTEPKIGTRKERHAATYPKIAGSTMARVLKFADRIANVLEGGKRSMYVKEHKDFRDALYVQHGAMQNPMIHAMQDHLDLLLRVE